MEVKPFVARTTCYVRESRTLVLASVGTRVGGPGSQLWSGGWTLGLGAADLALFDPQSAHSALLTAFLTRDGTHAIGPDARAAWMRTWRAVP